MRLLATRDRSWLRPRLALLLALQVADWLSTEIFLRLGVHEANPIVARLLHAPMGWQVLALKLAQVAVVAIWSGMCAHFAPRGVRLVLLICTLWMVIQVVWNLAAIALALYGIVS